MIADNDLTIFVLAPGGIGNIDLAVAASRNRAVGIVDLAREEDATAAQAELARVSKRDPGPMGIRLSADASDAWFVLADALRGMIRTVILTSAPAQTLRKAVQRVKSEETSVLVEATTLQEAKAAVKAGADALIAKGNEAAGRVSVASSLMLLQELTPAVGVPILVQGGVGLHTVGAFWTGGARGIVVDWQLALARESTLPEALQTRVRNMDGRETRCFGASIGEPCRLFVGGGTAPVREIEDLEHELHGVRAKGDRLRQWRARLAERMRFEEDPFLLPVSQDVGFASALAARYSTTADILRAFRRNLVSHVKSASRLKPLAEGQGSAGLLGSRYPIVQGPMSRVSDTPAFAAAIADAGGLPVMAGAMMAPDEMTAMLNETRELLGARPWGVGLLGFIDEAFYAQQVSLVKEASPSFVVLAGGTPAQAADLESAGIKAYIHAPSARLLSLYIQEGAKRFILEGRECGGHIGPYASTVLWERAIDTLLTEVPERAASEYDVWFAGGVHDDVSASMVATVAGPLAERGFNVGVLMATPYLFTREAVTSGAIGDVYQECVIEAQATDVLDSGGGYEVRTAPCPFTRKFANEKKRLRGEGKSLEEIRDALELLNLGRLRIAAKGVAFNVESLKDSSLPETLPVPAETQKRDGVFMAGQSISLHDHVSTVEALHEEISGQGMARLDEVTLPGASTAIEVSAPAAAPGVAVIGMAGIFPEASDVHAYWNNILSKVYAIKEVPPERWDVDRYFDEDPSARDKIYSKWGGFIDPILFDPTRFNIPPKALKSIDPLQLFPLEVTRRALVDAGYEDGGFDRGRTAVIFGVAGGMGEHGLKYGFRSVLPLLTDDIPEELLSQLPEWTEDSFAGILANVVAGRIANCFDMQGPNFTVDAACGTGLTAVYVAVREILCGSCDTALVGASDVMQNPFGFLCFSKARALSAKGIPRPFDAQADGIAIGEGVAAVFLKRQDLAERDGDRIYAVIRGVGSASDGRGASMTAPQTQGQVRAFDRAYSQAGFGIESIELFEAHGTGTKLGDGVEACSIQEALRAAGAPPKACAVGSVKSMIGHTKGCAGIAGVIKASLALYHKVLPPTLGVTEPAPAECWGAESPIYVNGETRPWIDHGAPRRAGVDAFGFGGADFHVVLEEHDRRAPEPSVCPLDEWPCELFCWSGPSAEAIREKIDALRDKLEAGAGPALRDLAALVTSDASAPDTTEGGTPLCLALVAESLDDLKEKLTTASDALADNPESISDPKGIYFSAKPVRDAGQIAFLFPGQGSQRPDMLRDLAVLFPEMRDEFARADRATAGRYPKRLSEYIFPPPRFVAEDEKACMAELTRTQVTQPALGAASMGLSRLLGLLGIKPQMTAGHSVGEYAALCAAEVLPEELLYELLEYRGRAIVESGRGDMGTMLAVKGGPDDVRPHSADVEDVHVANLNSPTQTILSGSKDSLETVQGRLKEAGLKCRFIPVSCAFHSPFVEPARQALAERLADTPLHPPAIPVYSNDLAAPYPGEEEDMRSILGRHLVRSVRFTEEIRAMYAQGARIFVEVGPGNVLTNLVKQILAEDAHVAVSTDAKSPRHDLFAFLQCIAQLAAQGVEIDPRALFERRSIAALSPETLESETAAAAPVAWMLGADGVWPPNEEKPSAKPVSFGRTAAETSTPPAPVAPGTASAPALPSVPPPVEGARAEALVRYQKLMAEFLQQQKDVIMTYLGAAGQAPAGGTQAAGVSADLLQSLSPPPAPAAPAQAPVAEQPAEPAEPEPVSEAGSTAPAAAAMDEAAMKAALVELVSERTGYPTEMLDVELDMEADLGIDSIKRVEILTAFGKSVPNPPADLADKLAGTRTLGEVLRVTVEACGSAPAPTSVASSSGEGDAGTDRVSQASLEESLVSLVSERTGYPAEMLDTALDMEADLGIDSIKRVEILTAFGKSLPNPPANLADRLAGTRTMAQVVETTLAAVSGSDAAAPSEDATPPSPDTTEPEGGDVRRYVIRLSELPSDENRATDVPAGVIAITDDGRGCAEAVRDAIVAKGGKAVVIRHGPRDGGSDPLETCDLTDFAAVTACVAALRREFGSVGGIIHLLPLRQASPVDELNAEGWQSCLDLEVKSLFLLLRCAAEDLQDGAGRWVLACTTLGEESSNGYLPQPSYPWRGGVMGLLKSVATEWPDALCKVVDVDAALPEQVASRVMAEAGSGDDEHEVYYRAGLRWVPRVSEDAVSAAEGASEPGEDSVILAIGGARGITAETTCMLAERFKPTIVLAGRSAWPADESPATRSAKTEADLKKLLFESMRRDGKSPKPIDVETACRRILMDREMRENRAAMEAAGARVSYVQADIQKEEDVQRLLGSIYETHGRLDGVLNGAGVIEDKLLAEKAPDSFERVFNIKARSVFLLSRHLRPETLKFLVLFSSVAGWFGNRGQTDYAAANEVLNRMAMYLCRHWQRHVVAVNWGPWAKTGMVTEEVRRQFAVRGIVPVDPEAGSRYLIDEICSGDTNESIVIAQGAAR